MKRRSRNETHVTEEEPRHESNKVESSNTIVNQYDAQVAEHFASHPTGADLVAMLSEPTVEADCPVYQNESRAQEIRDESLRNRFKDDVDGSQRAELKRKSQALFDRGYNEFEPR